MKDIVPNRTELQTSAKCRGGKGLTLLVFLLGLLYTNSTAATFIPNPSKVYFVDSELGIDSNNGTSKKSPWKSVKRIEDAHLNPGDSIRFKRGSKFEGTLTITSSGNSKYPITLTDYGSLKLSAPSFTNPIFNEGDRNFGNCIRLKGSYLIVENLYFHGTPAEISGDVGFLTMWELGAIYIDKTATHCIVRNNEIFDCGVGIKSYGSFAIIENNFIHDCNRVLKEWNWGPIGIWIGGDHQEVRKNRIINYKAVDPRINWGPNSYGGGADGSAIEIDDARENKSDIAIHHNYTRDCQGFLEVTWTDVQKNPDYKNFRIHHNISDDYQQFVALWSGAGFQIENNTIIRRKKNVNDWGVFNITQSNGKNQIRNNIVVVENNIPIYLLGKNENAVPNTIIEHNLYFAAKDSLIMGLDGPGKAAVYGDPGFRNYQTGATASDFEIISGSPAIDQGILLDDNTDFTTTGIPQGEAPDIGAFEYPNP